tara:strand:- start:4192 stop:6729 length:2538 start_codon:yes stop_codon:yes gene_type:complete
MADILYIDCNRENSIKSDENTNEWEFKLMDEALNLPAGTQVSIQESFINKKGVSGNTIVIDEDIATTIRYGYYITHSEHPVPQSSVRADGTGSSNLYNRSVIPTFGGDSASHSASERDWKNALTDPTAVNIANGVDFDGYGGYELPLCAIKITRYENTNGNQNWGGDEGTMEPMIGETEIYIPAGSYGVNEIAELIEDQLTGRLVNVRNGDFSTDFVKEKKENDTYRGTLENDRTVIMSSALPYNLLDGNGNYRELQANDNNNSLNYYLRFIPNADGNTQPRFRIPFYGENRYIYPQVGTPDTVQDTFKPLFFITPHDWNDLRDTHRRQNEWATELGGFGTPIKLGPPDHIPALPQNQWTPPNNELLYRKATFNWSYTQQQNSSAGTEPTTHDGGIYDSDWIYVKKRIWHMWRQVDFRAGQPLKDYNYAPQYMGMYVGAPEITFNWSAEASAFELNNLHFPYRFNSNDDYGNPIPEAGQEGILIKRVCDEFRKRGEDANGNPIYVDNNLISGLEEPISRIGGINVFNWSVEVAQDEGDVDTTDATQFAQGVAQQKMWDFNEYFTDRDKAEKAWKKTIWSRLGFTYNQLQNKDNYEMSRYKGEGLVLNPRLHGTTTKPSFDPAIISTISSAFNIGRLQVGDISNITPRVYSNLDVGTAMGAQSSTSTSNPYQTAQPTGVGTPFDNSAQYYSSPYKKVTTAPIQTSGKAITATFLPTLSTDGYYLITSNIIDGYKDRVKRGTPIALLGVVPISNLSSQDFIQTRNEIVHTIQNQTVLNSIKIKVLTPDLTAPRLEANSSVILKIVRPLQIENHIGDIDHRPEVEKNTQQKQNIKASIENPQKNLRTI